MSKTQTWRTLRRATPPWSSSLEHQGILLGAESLAGQAVISRHLETNQRLGERVDMSPGYPTYWERSAAAAPIMHVGNIAGSLLVSSTQLDYFSPKLLRLVEGYAELIALAFEPQDFYEPEQIELGTVPSFEEQLPYISQYRNWLNETIIQAARDQRPITILQAEQSVWQRLEEQLLYHYFTHHNG